MSVAESAGGGYGTIARCNLDIDTGAIAGRLADPGAIDMGAATFELDWNLDGDTQVDVVVAPTFAFGDASTSWRRRDGRDPRADETAPLV